MQSNSSTILRLYTDHDAVLIIPIRDAAINGGNIIIPVRQSLFIGIHTIQ